MTQKIHYVPQHPKIPVYKNDGIGRDTYISFYNGGFGCYKLTDTYAKEKIESPKHLYHQNLALCKPTKKYFTDGNGRDTYVYNGMLEEHDKCQGNLRLPNILRSYNTLQYPMKTSGCLSPSKFEKKLINRIFYGKSADVKDRQMSPKVRFVKKEDIIAARKRREEGLDIEEEKSADELNNCTDKNDTVPNLKTMNNYNSRYEEDKKDYIMTEENKNDTSLNNTNTINQSYCLKKKNSPRRYKPELGLQSDDLMNSVRKIFLYNNRMKTTGNNNMNLSQKNLV